MTLLIKTTLPTFLFFADNWIIISGPAIPIGIATAKCSCIIQLHSYISATSLASPYTAVSQHDKN